MRCREPVVFQNKRNEREMMLDMAKSADSSHKLNIIMPLTQCGKKNFVNEAHMSGYISTCLKFTTKLTGEVVFLMLKTKLLLLIGKQIRINKQT